MKKSIILLIITIIFLYFVCNNLDIYELLKTIRQFKIVYIIPLICSILISLSLRGLVFKQLLKKTLNPPLLELSHLCITSAALNILFPARAGDIFRAIYIGNKYDVNKLKVLGTVIFERIFDVIIIFSFLFVGIFVYQKNQIAMNLCLFAGVFAIICFGVILLVYRFKNDDEISNENKHEFSSLFEKFVIFVKRSFNSFFRGFEAVESPKNLLFALLSSFFIWVFECLNYYILIIGFNCDIHWSVTLFVIGFIALACMVPSTSIFVGPYQAAVIAAFNIYGINKETALAISIVEQSVVIIVTSITAIIFFVIHNVHYNPVKIQEEIGR